MAASAGKRRKTRELLESQNAPIYKLNDDCLIHIFKYLRVQDRIKIERVSKRWCSLSKECWRDFKTLNIERLAEIFAEDQENWSLILISPFHRFEIIKSILNRAGRFLTSLDLSSYNMYLVGDTCRASEESIKMLLSLLTIIRKKCTNLEYMNLGNLVFPKMGTQKMKNVFKKLKILEMKSSELCLYYNGHPKRQDFIRFFSSFCQLEKLILNSDRFFLNHVLDIVAENCTTLKCLKLKNFYHHMNPSFEDLTKLKKLEELHVTARYVSNVVPFNEFSLKKLVIERVDDDLSVSEICEALKMGKAIESVRVICSLQGVSIEKIEFQNLELAFEVLKQHYNGRKFIVTYSYSTISVDRKILENNLTIMISSQKINNFPSRLVFEIGKYNNEIFEVNTTTKDPQECQDILEQFIEDYNNNEDIVEEILLEHGVLE